MGTVSVNPPKTPVTEGSSGLAVATVPNICKMPGPPAPFIPVPLPNIGKSGSSPKKYTKDVKVEKKPVAVKGASFGSQGDMASKGTGGGLVSSNTHGPTKFIGPGSMDVKFEGKNVHLLSDPTTNNCGSPANSATVPGLLQGPGVPTPDLVTDLREIAKQCNDEINKKGGYSESKPPRGKPCAKLGTEKHECCEKKIKQANHPCVKSEQGYNRDGTPSAKTKGQALNEGRKAAQAARQQGLSKEAQKSAFGRAFGKNVPPIQLDVVILKDPSKGLGKDNVLRVIDFKFNCGPKGKMSKAQKVKYTQAMEKRPRIIHASW